MPLENLSQDAELRVKITSDDPKQIIDAIAELNRRLGHANPNVDGLEKNLSRMGRTASGAGDAGRKAGKQIADGAQDGSAAWRELTKQLREANEAYREFRRGAVTGEGGGRDVSQYSIDELREFLRVQDAANANFVSAARERVRMADDTGRAIEQSEQRSAEAIQRTAAEERRALEARLNRARVGDSAAWDRQFKEATEAANKAQRESIRIARERERAFEAMGRTLEEAERRATRASAMASSYQSEMLSKRMSVYSAADAQAWDRQFQALEQNTRGVSNLRAAAAGLSDGELPRLRYALYDVASTALVTSTALTGMVTAAAVASARYESAFTAVERTSGVAGESVQALKNELIGLTRDIPVNFQDIAGIATLGAQMDIAAADLENFARVVSEFSATAGTTVDASAEGFGRIGQLLGVAASQYENLGSAILYAGNTSVATEQDVLSYSERLAQVMGLYDAGASDVVAYASTLASVSNGLEASQGAMQRIFGTITEAVSEGGDALEMFAATAGMSAEQFQSAWRQNALGTFTDIIGGLQGIDAEGRVAWASALGLNETRNLRTLNNLANNYDLLSQQINETGRAFTDGTYLADSYGKVVDDLASRWQIFLNNVMAFGAAAGDAVAPAIIAILDSLSGFLTLLTNMLQTPAGQFFAQLAITLGAVGAAFTGIVGGAALFGGSLAAIRTGLTMLIPTLGTATTGVSGFAAGMLGVSTATGGAATALRVFRVALASTGIGLAVVALGSLATAFMQAGDSAEGAFNTYVTNTAGLAEAIAADTQAYYQAVADGNWELADSFERLSPIARDNASAWGENAQAAANAAHIMGVAAPTGIGASTNAISQNTAYVGENTTAWLRNALAQSEAFQQLVGAGEEVTAYWDTLSQHGFEMDEMLRIAAAEGTAAVYEYIHAAETRAIQAGANIQAALTRMQAGNLSLNGTWINGNARTVEGLTKTAVGAGFAMRMIGQEAANVAPVITKTGYDGAAAFDDLARSIGGGGGGGGGGGASSAARELQKEVRTVADYARDLDGVMQRAFEIRWGSQQALDTIQSGWQAIADRTEEANRQAAEYRDELRGLYADRDIKEYWLTVAEMYGDELRAAELRADLAEINTNVANTQKSLREEQDKASGTLVGNSKAAIENRAALLGLVGNYQQYLVALAASGASQAEVQAEAERLEREFIQQATQMGFNRQEAEKYTQSFRDMRTVIQQLPRNVTVTADINPALTALREFEARVRSAMTNARNTVGKGISIPIASSYDAGGAAKAGRAAQLQATIAEYQRMLARDPGNRNYLASLKYYSDKLASGNYWTGGYTGDGGKFQPAGIVHKGEYVFSKKATQNLGVGNLAMLHKLGQTGQGFAAGSPAASASMGTTQLSPYDRMLLQTIADRVGLTITESSLQGAVNGANFDTTRRRGA